MRKLGYVLLGLVVLLVIAALALPRLVDVNSYRPRIQAELQQRLGRPVQLGTMHLRVLPLSIRVENIVIAEDPNYRTGRPFAQAPNLFVSARLWPLLHGSVEVSSLELERPAVELVRDAKGAWNFASLGQSKTQKPQAQSTAPSVTLDHFTITDGVVALTDFQKHQTRAVYDHIDLDLGNFAPDKQFDLKLAAHLPGEGKQLVQLSGSAGPMKQGDFLATPFQGSLELDQVAVAALQKFLNSEALRGIEATISGKASARNEGGKVASDGSLKIEKARLRGVEVGYPITLDYKGSDDLTQDVIRIDQGTLKLGATPVSLTGTINTRPDPSQLDVHVTAQNASISEVARLAGAMGVAFNPGTKVDGRVNADITARGAANAPALNGRLVAQDVKISGGKIAKPVEAKSIELALTPDAIRSNQFTIASGGTSLNAKFDLQRYTTPQPMIDLGLSTSNAQLGEVLQIAQAYGVSAADDMSGTGVLNLNVHAVGSIKRTEAMTFSGNGSLQNATLQTASLKQPLHVKNMALQFTQNSVVMQNLAASLGSTNAGGQLTLRNFQAPQVQFALTADKLNVNELQQLVVSQPNASASPQQPGNPRAADGTSKAAQPSGLANVSGGGTINVGNIHYNQIDLNDVKATAMLDHGVIRLAPITAQAFGGVEQGSITADTRATPMTVEMVTNLQRADANKVLSSVSNLKQTLYGLLGVNGQTRFALGASEADIARSLNGKVSLNLQDGKLMNMDMLNELASIGKFLNGGGQAKQNFTNIVKLAGDFVVQNGVATTDNLKAAIQGGTLAAAGSANLADQTLNMHVTAVLDKDYSQKVGGTGIGGLMQTALANSQGELVVPVIITGSFTSPKFAPDVQQLAQMKLQNLLPTSGNPGQLTTGILGAVLGGKSGGAQGGGGLQGILGALGGQKQQQQQEQQGQAPQSDQAQPPKQQQQQQPNAADLLNQIINSAKKKQDQQQQQKQPQQPPK
jgi:uncharacterized protein involved in outer membrane biogenesis